MGADGSNPTRITTAGGGSPAWSPDGTRLAFMTARDGNWEVYAINIDGTGETNLTNDPQHNTFPDWGRISTPTPTPTITPVVEPTPTPNTTTFVVNPANDPGTGVVCDAAECTLREASTAANSDAGAETITFDLPGAGPHTIQLSSAGRAAASLGMAIALGLISIRVLLNLLTVSKSHSSNAPAVRRTGRATFTATATDVGM